MGKNENMHRRADLLLRRAGKDPLFTQMLAEDAPVLRGSAEHLALLAFPEKLARRIILDPDEDGPARPIL
jgi:hypothetical protein